MSLQFGLVVGFRLALISSSGSIFTVSLLVYDTPLDALFLKSENTVCSELFFLLYWFVHAMVCSFAFLKSRT